MSKYKWSFANVGGVTRVRIQSAEDIRHLGELDKKMWTVLSCPVDGLEISSESLKAMDVDGDGLITDDDAKVLLKRLSGITSDKIYGGDADKNNTVNILDVIAIEKMLEGR